MYIQPVAVAEKKKRPLFSIFPATLERCPSAVGVFGSFLFLATRKGSGTQVDLEESY
jgi:hypothetical protein